MMNITDTQRANLETLASWLIENADQIEFDMSRFAYILATNECGEKISTYVIPTQMSYGTVGCAVGHGPLAGIAPAPWEPWDDYADRCFTNCDPAIWAWCFSDDWAKQDNTASGAGRRIRYMLEHGVPDVEKSSMIRNGCEPLPY